MQHNGGAQLDTSVVEDGRSGGFGLGGLAAGIGIIGVVRRAELSEGAGTLLPTASRISISLVNPADS